MVVCIETASVYFCRNLSTKQRLNCSSVYAFFFSGVITLLQLLNFEVTSEYVFEVQASDISSDPMTTSVDVM